MASPRSSANCRSSSTSPSSSLVGVSTRSTTRRSPRPRPLTEGTPLPRIRNSRPLWVPASDGQLLLVAVEGDEGEVGAERGLGEADRDVGHEVVALADEVVVGGAPAGGRRGHRTPRRAGRPRLAPTGAGWSRSRRRQARRPGRCAPRRCAPRRGSVGARRDDHLTEPAAAASTGPLVTICPRMLLADPPDLAGTAALGAGDRRGARRGAAARARVAGDRGAHGDRSGAAEDRLLERQAGPRPPRSWPRGGPARPSPRRTPTSPKNASNRSPRPPAPKKGSAAAAAPDTPASPNRS